MKLLFGSVVAVVLLGLYVYTVATGVSIAQCVADAGCAAAGFTTGMASTLSLTHGLVSALVVAELAITEPGQAPMARVLAGDATGRAVTAVKVVTALYLLVWVAAGLWAYFVGFLKHPGVLPALTDVGQSWFGVAIAAGYSYFGVKRGA
jgi:predicted metal-binding membrane protein